MNVPSASTIRSYAESQKQREDAERERREQAARESKQEAGKGPSIDPVHRAVANQQSDPIRRALSGANQTSLAAEDRARARTKTRKQSRLAPGPISTRPAPTQRTGVPWWRKDYVGRAPEKDDDGGGVGGFLRGALSGAADLGGGISDRAQGAFGASTGAVADAARFAAHNPLGRAEAAIGYSRFISPSTALGVVGEELEAAIGYSRFISPQGLLSGSKLVREGVDLAREQAERLPGVGGTIEDVNERGALSTALGYPLAAAGLGDNKTLRLVQATAGSDPMSFLGTLVNADDTFFERTATDFAETFLGIPAGVALAGNAVKNDFGDAISAFNFDATREEIKNVLTGLPGDVKTGASALGGDIKDIGSGDFGFGDTRDIIADKATAVPGYAKDRVADLAKDVNDFKSVELEDVDYHRSQEILYAAAKDTVELAKDPAERPFSSALVVTPAAAGGVASGLVRTTAAIAAGRAATGLGRATAPFIRAPLEGGSLLRRPLPGRIEYKDADGNVTAVRPLSTNPLVAGFQQARARSNPNATQLDALAARRQEGAARTKARRQVDEPLATAPAKALAKEAKRGRLTPSGRRTATAIQMAARIDLEGSIDPESGLKVTVQDRIDTHMRDLEAAADVPGLRGDALRRRLTNLIRVTESAREYIDETPDGPKATAEALHMRDLMEKSAVRQEGLLDELGYLDPEGARASFRRSAPGKQFLGAQFMPEGERSFYQHIESLGLDPDNVGRVTTQQQFGRPSKTTGRIPDELANTLVVTPSNGSGRVVGVDPDRQTVTVAVKQGGQEARIEVDPKDLSMPGEYRGPGSEFKGGTARVPVNDPNQGLRFPSLVNGIISPAPVPARIKQQFAGGSISQGRLPLRPAEVMSREELALAKVNSTKHLHRDALATAISVDDYLKLSPGQQKHYAPVVRDPGSRVPGGLAAERFARDSDAAAVEDGPGGIRDADLFPEKSAAELEAMGAAQQQGIRMYDRRKMGDLREDIEVKNRFLKVGLGVFDEINNAAVTSLLLTKPAYLVANAAGQSLLALTHQGVLAPWNMARAVREIQRLTPEHRAATRDMMQNGLVDSFNQGGGISAITANARARAFKAAGEVLDTPFRLPAFVHEARKLGYGDGKPKQLHELFDDQNRGDLLESVDRANDAMIDYQSMGPVGRAFGRRVTMFFPFIKGASEYTGRLARDNPIKTATLAQIGRLGADVNSTLAGTLPGNLQGSFPVGTSESGDPEIVNPRSSAIHDVNASLAGVFQGIIGPNKIAAGDSIINLATAVPQTAYELAFKRDAFTGFEFGEGDRDPLSILESQFKGYVPPLAVYEAYRDGGRGELLHRTPNQQLGQYLTGLAPATLDQEKGRDIVSQESGVAEPETDKTERLIETVTAEAARLKVHDGDVFKNGQPSQELIDAYHVRSEYREEKKAREDEYGDTLPPEVLLDITLEIGKENNLVPAREEKFIRQELREIQQDREISEKERKQEIYNLVNEVMREDLNNSVISYAHGELTAAGAEVDWGKPIPVAIDEFRTVFDEPDYRSR